MSSSEISNPSTLSDTSSRDTHIERIVADAPPLDPEVVQEIAALLTGGAR